MIDYFSSFAKRVNSLSKESCLPDFLHDPLKVATVEEQGIFQNFVIPLVEKFHLAQTTAQEEVIIYAHSYLPAAAAVLRSPSITMDLSQEDILSLITAHSAALETGLDTTEYTDYELLQITLEATLHIHGIPTPPNHEDKKSLSDAIRFIMQHSRIDNIKGTIMFLEAAFRVYDRSYVPCRLDSEKYLRSLFRKNLRIARDTDKALTRITSFEGHPIPKPKKITDSWDVEDIDRAQDIKNLFVLLDDFENPAIREHLERLSRDWIFTNMEKYVNRLNLEARTACAAAAPQTATVCCQHHGAPPTPTIDIPLRTTRMTD